MENSDPSTAAPPPAADSQPIPHSQASSQPKSEIDGGGSPGNGIASVASTNSTPPVADTATSPPSGDAHETSFARPSTFLHRPRAHSRPVAHKPKRKIDIDEEIGLVRINWQYGGTGWLTAEQKKIRDFLRARTAYDVLPLSFRLIELDVGLTVKESLNILVQCGMW